jgi:hypothetical protein
VREEGAENANAVLTPDGRAANTARQQVISANIDKLYAGAPEEYKALKRREELQKYHQDIMNAMATPEMALEYLEERGVQSAMGAAKVKEYRAKFGKTMIEGAKKQSENDMRQLGIRLGDTYDNEYEIIKALEGVEDRELANIARTEAETVRNARLAMGKGARDDAEEEYARVNASAIAAAAGDEMYILETTSNMEGVTEKFRKRVFDLAVTEMKIRQTREVTLKAKQTEQAMETLARADWSPTAISPDWPADLQVKMTETCEKMQNRTARADPVAALELCEMDAEDLKAKVRAGEWGDMSIILGGKSTPEYKHVWKKAFESGASSGEIGNQRSPLMYGKDEFSRITQLNPSTTEGKIPYSQFLNAYESALIEKARDLELSSINDVPRGEQDKIIDDLMRKGEFADDWRNRIPSFARDFVNRKTGWLGQSSYRRFEAIGNPQLSGMEFVPFDNDLAVAPSLPRDDLAAYDGKPYRRTNLSADELPSWARSAATNGDRYRTVYPDGAVEIVDRAGQRIMIYNESEMERFPPVAGDASPIDADDLADLDEEGNRLLEMEAERQRRARMAQADESQLYR